MNNQNLPAVRQEAPVATADTDSWVQMMGPLVKLAESVATTEFVPKNLRGKPAAVTAALLEGEVSLQPRPVAASGALVSTVKVALAAEPVSRLPAESEDVPALIVMPTVPLPVQQVSVTVRVDVPAPLVSLVQLAPPVVLSVTSAAASVTELAPV